ncbi:hypothetical protein LWC35_31520 [Pseudonocardia kujensis]|uniref:hypothetical protein n=1 Tax=Pseudonocardia kujensis TaxID=1128675 RepID=UPI001E36C299|nr:hypothetical protein [Pseudonocardia kujensis]MCE0767396.1 hypothetical protein [Pseudonocardia kujensis]
MSVRATRPACTPVVATTDPVVHEVAEDEMVAGTADGVYRALCGQLILPASLAETPHGTCAGCAAARLHSELPVPDGYSRSWRRGIAGAARECAGLARCAFRLHAAAAA